MRKIENARDYIGAKDAALILSQKHGREVRPDYIARMILCKKHRVRTVQYGRVQMYHREDIAACTITFKRHLV